MFHTKSVPLRKLLLMAWERAANSCLLPLSLHFHTCIVKPTHVYWIMSRSCNFRCSMCSVWEGDSTKASKDLVTLPQIKKVIDSLSQWGVTQFGISGGEPLLDSTKLLAVLGYANEQGLYTHFVTNGYLLTENILKEYNNVGGGYITFSLDGMETTHDKIRNKKGSFQRCFDSLLLISQGTFPTIKAKITTVLSNENLEDIPSLFALAEKLSIPILIQPYLLANPVAQTITGEELSKTSTLWIPPQRIPLLTSVVSTLCELKKRKPHVLLNSLSQLQEFPTYFQGIHLRPPTSCTVGYMTIFIFPSGEVKSCSTENVADTVGNIKKTDIRAIWNSPLYTAARRKMSRCGFRCLLGCHSKMELFNLIRVGFRWLYKS